MYIKYKNKNIHFNDTGKGDVIVLLHGFLENSNIWDLFVKKLSTKYRLVTIDLPGHGKTDDFEITHTMDFMAECVKQVLDNLNINKCVMIGHSMGGYVSLSFADKYKEYLKGIGLFHSHASGDNEQTTLNRERTIAIVKLNHQGYINNFIPDLFTDENKEKYKSKINEHKKAASLMTKESIISALEGMKQRTSKLDILINIDVPVLFIIGKKDTRFPFNKSIAETMLPKHSEVSIFDDVAHMGFIEAQEETIKSIECFAYKAFEENCFEKSIYYKSAKRL